MSAEGRDAVEVEFHFDFGSPNAYLAHRVLPAIAARTGARLAYVPVLLGGIFKLTGNRSPAVSLQGIRNKPEYEALEMRRFMQRHDIRDFQMNPHFPVNTLQLMRGAVAARRLDCFEPFVEAMYRRMWSQPEKLDDPDVLLRVLREEGFDAEPLLAAAQDPEVKAELLAQTERSVERGAFGSPTFFVGEEMFFGKDRLEEVEREILRQQAALARLPVAP